MKIAVCGSSEGNIKKNILKKSREIGIEIAKQGHTLMFGACLGYPYEASKGAFENQGKIIGISPAKDENKHKNTYGFPNDTITKIDYTGLGIPGRNLPLIKNSDAVIIISGQIGTLNEFTLAFQLKKRIGILQGSDGITNIIDKIIDICDDKRYNMKNKITINENPKILINNLSQL